MDADTRFYSFSFVKSCVFEQRKINCLSKEETAKTSYTYLYLHRKATYKTEHILNSITEYSSGIIRKGILRVSYT